jgi:hypothetical protein
MFSVADSVEKLGSGLGWSKSKTNVARLLMAANLCYCIVPGYLVFQFLAFRGMRQYGIGWGLLGVHRETAEAAILKLKNAESGMQSFTEPPSSIV